MSLSPYLGSIMDCVLLVLYFYVFWVQGSESNRDTVFPAPVLTQEHPKAGGMVELLCRVTGKLGGIRFQLYEERELVDTQEFEHDKLEARFSLPAVSVTFQKPYCCLYQGSQGLYSAFSPYLQLSEHASFQPPPPPVLTVEPPNGQVSPGQYLYFTCSAPTHQTPAPQTYLLQKTPLGSERTRFRVAEGRKTDFKLGPVGGDDGGWYTCLYQATLPVVGKINSTTSKAVKVTVTSELPRSTAQDLLPPPSLSLLQQSPSDGDESLKCQGSPAYPGALFLLFREGCQHPVTTQYAPHTQYSIIFLLPAPEQPQEQYQCQYTVQLGQTWSYSHRSPTVEVSRLTDTAVDLTPEPPPSLTDWPLIAGSAAAALLLLALLVGLALAVRWKVKALAEKNQKREEARFWHNFYAPDHVIDHTLQRDSVGSQELNVDNTNVDGKIQGSTTCESVSVVAQYPFSTFIGPHMT